MRAPAVIALAAAAIGSILSATALSSPALAEALDAPSHTFRPIDLFSLNAATDPQIRPDGKVVAYVRQTYDILTDTSRGAIWAVDLATGAQSPITSTIGAASMRSPRWSPDGTRLAFIADGGGQGSHLYVRDSDTGAVTSIGTLPEQPRAFAWSPDGRSIAFTMLTADDPATLGTQLKPPAGAKWADPLKVITAATYRHDDAGYAKPGFIHIYVVPADGGSSRQLTFGAFNEQDAFSWSADGRRVLFTANRNPDWQRQGQQFDVFSVSVADGTLKQLTNSTGPGRDPQMSPDGKLIAYTDYEQHNRGYENTRLLVMGADGTSPRVLTGALDRSVSRPRWSGDGQAIFVKYDDHGSGKVTRVSLNGTLAPVAQGMSGTGGPNGAALDEPYSGGEYSVSRGGLVAFTQGAPDEPGDIATADGRGPVKRLTHLNDALFYGKSLGKVEAMTVPSNFDKLPIDAWIITPPNFDPGRKYPMIMQIHGGPYGAFGPQFASMLQLYASAGYVVVYANPRGSTSYGFAFADQIHYNNPNRDYDDLMSVVDATIAKGFVDPSNLFVTGGSAGGMMTAWIVGKTDRFKAAVTVKPVINRASHLLTTDGYMGEALEQFGKQPWEDYEAFWKRSPLSLVGNVKTPTMVMVGEEDHRTPTAEAEQFYDALQIRGVPSMLIRVPGANHMGLAARPSQQAAEAAAIIGWFDRYRTPGS